MSATIKLVLLAALLGALWSHDVRADRKTVCTITVNSPDEREMFRRALPPDEYQFVELVERGRPDWLASACRQGVHCDALIISGHFDDGSEFYSDRVDAREFLPVDEMERVSCSDTCPGLFSQLKEVYLFGCNTLNTGARKSASGEIERSLVRAGNSPADTERRMRVLDELYAESNRDRMRSIFKGVPVIYGFSKKAPLGPTAASLLERFFRSGAGSEIGSGRASAKLVNLFAPSSMTVASGLRDDEPQSAVRQDVCHFSDDRLSPAEKLGFVHQLLHRDVAEVRMFLDHIERYAASLAEGVRQSPPVAKVRADIARDQAARTRYLELARDADEPAVRARMIDLARDLGWLSPAEQRAEFIQMIGDRMARNAVGAADVELVCSRNRDGELGPEISRLQLSRAQADTAANAAVLACLGSREGHARVLKALASVHESELQIAQVYVRHHPIADVAELRAVTAEIARMNGSLAQVRALDTLANLRLSDRQSLDELARLFPAARSVDVQRAIAGVLIHGDYQVLATPDLARTLRQHRLKSPDGEDMIDVLIRRLKAT